jgi:Cu2+-exporting ATPase
MTAVNPAALGAAFSDHDEARAPVEFDSAVERDPSGAWRLHLMVEGIHCGACVQSIEKALGRDPAVTSARVNLTTRRLVVTWSGERTLAARLAGAVEALGYRLAPFRPAQVTDGEGAAERALLRALSVAGFAAANVMLLSIALWAGDAQGMEPATRSLLHWFAALIALPAVAYAGRPFFRSALSALLARRTNMDVPISLAVVLASAMSLFETLRGGEQVYFDSAIALLFFLLVGRYLDRRARSKARSAAERLLTLRGQTVTLLDPDGRARTISTEQVEPGMRVLVAAGERVPIDGRVTAGRSELDRSLITGESLPAAVARGDQVFAGTLNLGAPLTLEVSAVGEATLLAEIVRLMELAEQRRSGYVSLADRVARLYAPLVHGLALATFLGWVLVGTAWQVALLYGVAVLIITCPCALGLAVPVVQVIASGRLLRQGILLKSATALERLVGIDGVAFDKTGTLTEGHPTLVTAELDREALLAAAALAGASRHPLAHGLARAAPEAATAEGVREVPGRGLVLETAEGEIRLGSRAWCGLEDGPPAAGLEDGPPAAGPELWLSRPGRPPVRFRFTDPLRADAAQVVGALARRGLAVELLSGDRRETVAAVAVQLGIADWRAQCSPSDKVARLEALSAEGRRILMVGDGLNDAPALAAAAVSVSPSSAVDISQTAADAVFQGRALAPILELLEVARRTQRLVRQNLALAFLYNLLTVPLAVLGYVTPLVAAICMSASSLAVIANALRLGRGGRS